MWPPLLESLKSQLTRILHEALHFAHPRAPFVILLVRIKRMRLQIHSPRGSQLQLVRILRSDLAKFYFKKIRVTVDLLLNTERTPEESAFQR